MKFDGFLGQSAAMSSMPINSQMCVNWYPERPLNEDASTNLAWRPVEGYSLYRDYIGLNDISPIFKVHANSAVRGMYRTARGLGSNPSVNGSVIVVVGQFVVWEKFGSGANEILGYVSELSTPVSMVDDGFGLIIVDGVSMYRLDLATKSFSQLPYELSNPQTVAFMGGHTITQGTISGVPSGSFFVSDLYDNSTWNALEYGTAESSADPLTAVLVNGSYLWLFGPSSYELWNPTGDSRKPFDRAYAAAGTIGLVAPRSVLSVGNNVVMVGSSTQGSPSIYMSSGTSFNKISTPALEQEMSKYDCSDCVTFSYTSNGHTFVVFNFDAMDKTYVYDISDGQKMWHQRSTRDQLTDTMHRWYPNSLIQYAGKTYVGNRYAPKIYELSQNYTLEDGNTILRIGRTAFLRSPNKYLRVWSVGIEVDAGNGITNEDPNRLGEEPELMMQYSWDYMRTFSSELKEGIGRLGDYTKTVIFSGGLGTGRVFGVEFRLSDSCNTSILNGWIDVEVGTQRT